ncbi:MAG: hypothetical protein IJ094_01590 [Bacilli bacterium]|nr:hypothetical protein [Bacilli bacterium]
MKELKATIEMLKSRLSKHINEGVNPDLFDDTLFLIEKQDLYIKKLEELLDIKK